MAKVNDYLSVGAAAQFLGVSKDTLRRWDRAGKLRAYRHPITSYRLYLRRELENLLNSIKQNTGPDGREKARRPTRKSRYGRG